VGIAPDQPGGPPRSGDGLAVSSSPRRNGAPRLQDDGTVSKPDRPPVTAGPPAPHWDPDTFRAHGYAVVDRVARYLEEVGSLPVRSRARPGELRAALPPRAPEHGEDFARILEDVDRLIVPGLTHWQSPSFFAYFPANASPPAILGELLSAGFGVQGMLWATSPACTELETHVLDWLVDLLGLPARLRSDGPGGGVIQDTASSSTLCALLAARERATEGAANREGARAPLTVYASTETHSSLEKAVRIAGLGDAALRRVDTDAALAMDPGHLATLMAEDRAAGRTPCFVCATLGTTSTTAFDPVPAVAAVCRAHGAWLHVDAAYAGSAAVCPELRWMNAGLEHADSYCFNPHKWLLTNFDCNCFWVADRAALLAALSVLPEYLRNAASESGAVIDYRDWQVPLGRRFRALKLWFVIRSYGAQGLRAHVREHLRLARRFADSVDGDPNFERVAPAPLALVCFRHRGDDRFNERLLDTLNDEGHLFLTHTRVHGRFVLRMAIGGTWTRQEHVDDAWARIRDTAERLEAAA
jgi:aromatic-L-amino-acid decarboxylase